MWQSSIIKEKEREGKIERKQCAKYTSGSWRRAVQRFPDRLDKTFYPIIKYRTENGDIKCGKQRRCAKWLESRQN
jgi:hypothetical protein